MDVKKVYKEEVQETLESLRHQVGLIFAAMRSTTVQWDNLSMCEEALVLLEDMVGFVGWKQPMLNQYLWDYMLEKPQETAYWVYVYIRQDTQEGYRSASLALTTLDYLLKNFSMTQAEVEAAVQAEAELQLEEAAEEE